MRDTPPLNPLQPQNSSNNEQRNRVLLAGGKDTGLTLPLHSKAPVGVFDSKF